jgi:small Trp-rich protein
MQAVTIETMCKDFMRVPDAAAKGRSATMQDNGRALPALTRERNRAPEVHMLFVLIGVILIVLNLLEIGVVGTWNWQLTGDLWKFFFPFLLASLWWVWSDKSGLNKRREMDRMEKKKSDRRKENLAALGMDTRSRRKAQKPER